MSTKSGIAVGVDGFWASAGAVDWALAESTFSSQPVEAIHVVDTAAPTGPHFSSPKSGHGAKRLVAEVVEYLTGHGAEVAPTTDLLGRTAAVWRNKYPDVTFETDVRRGHTVYGLNDAVKDTGAQLLVLAVVTTTA